MVTPPATDAAGDDGCNQSSSGCCWLLSVLSCVAATLIYVLCLIGKYIDCPVRTQVDVSYNETMPLPAITICPIERFDVRRLDALWHRHFDPEYRSTDAINSTIQYQQLADVMDVMSLWQSIAFQDQIDLIPICYQGRGTTCVIAGNFRSIYTPSGSCFIYYSENKMLTGYYYGLYLRMQNRHVATTAWKISFHETWKEVPILEVARQFIQVETVLTTSGDGSFAVRSDYLNVLLVPKQYVRLDRLQRPCDRQGPDHETACQNECFERAVTSVTGCKLPFMKVEEVPYCSNSSSVRLTEQLSDELITGDKFLCNCLPSCTKVSYHRFDQVVKEPKSYGVMRVYYNVPLWRTVREVPVYNSERLRCDIENMLCLMLGASVPSLCQCCEWIVTQLLLNRR